MSENLLSQIESLLFISPRPLTVAKIAEITQTKKENVSSVARQLMNEFNKEGRGIHIIEHENSYQMTTSGENRPFVEGFIRDELTGELTRPSLETLTIIAYRGPVSKVELELIRGVNCSIILRNLMMRGLVDGRDDKSKMQTYYSVSLPFLKYLGIQELSQLPDYGKFRNNKEIDKFLNGSSAGNMSS